MYIVYCPGMWTEEKKFTNSESLTDIFKYLETCRISESQIVKIAHVGTSDLTETWETVKDNVKHKKIKIYLEPTDSGARVDL